MALGVAMLLAPAMVPAAAAVSDRDAAGAAARTGTPLGVRNLSPATQIFGLPRPLGAVAQPGVGVVSLVVEHANNFTGAVGDTTSLLFDGSTTVASLGWRSGFRQRLEWGVEIPYVLHSGGITDGFIDGFHDLFGFPDGGREARPRDLLSYRISHDGEELVAVDSATGNLGDVRGWLGVRLGGGDRTGALRAMIKAPTGELEDLSGSGGADASLALELVDGASLAKLGVSMTLMAAVTAVEDGDLERPEVERLVYSAHFGLHKAVSRRVVLRAQIDAHSEVVDSGARQFSGGTVQGTLGGTVRLSGSSWLDLGLSEDLAGASAPDVVFFLTLGSRL